MDIDTITKLYYRDKLGSREIATRLNKTVWQILRFMKKHHLKCRTSAETNKYKFNRTPLSFNKKVHLNAQEKELFENGLMLYWAEGCKQTNQVVDMSNSNPKMVKIFRNLLTNIYQVDQKRIRVLLYCYQNQDINNLRKFWSNFLDIPLSQFIKPYIRKDFDHNKNSKMPYGLAHIRYADTRLLAQIFRDIDIISDKLCRDGGVDNHTSL